MPGVTSLNAGPHAARSIAASCAEHTTPSRPFALASWASRSACASGVPPTPIAARSDASRLVSTVMAINNGRGRRSSAAVFATASRAAASIAAPPAAWTSIIQTPRRVAAAQACATVLGMS
jgi:hypothetical protein